MTTENKDMNNNLQEEYQRVHILANGLAECLKNIKSLINLSEHSMNHLRKYEALAVMVIENRKLHKQIKQLKKLKE